VCAILILLVIAVLLNLSRGFTVLLISLEKFIMLQPSSLFPLLLIFITFQAASIHPSIAQDYAWHIIPVSKEPEKREDCGFVESSGKFYLIGGRGILPVEVFDPTTNRWEKKKHTPIEMHHFQAMTFGNEIYVVAGMSGKFPHEKPFENIYIYNPAKDEWRKGAEIPVDRRRGSGGTVVFKNRIYLIGGIKDGHYEGTVNWLDVFDPATGKWHVLPDAPHARDHIQAVIIDGKIYVAGGRKTSFKTNQIAALTVAEVDLFDVKKQQWKTLPALENLPTERAGATAIAFKKNLIVMGGESIKQEVSHNEAEVLDTKKRTWSSLPPLVTGRHDTQAIYYKGTIYIVAGSANRGGGPDQSSIEKIELK
jgi:N-acetylneuraminic acid mutarotase